MRPFRGRRSGKSGSGGKNGQSKTAGGGKTVENVRWRDRFAVKATIFTAEQIAIMQVVDGLNNMLYIDEGSSKVGNAIEKGAQYIQSKFIDWDDKTGAYEDGLLNDVLEFFGDEDFDEGLSDVTYMITYAGVYIVENALLRKLKGGYVKGKDRLSSSKTNAKQGFKNKADKAKETYEGAKSTTINLAVEAAVKLAHGSKYLRVNIKFLVNKLKKKGSISKKDLEDATGKTFNKTQTNRFYEFISKLKTKTKAERTNKDNIFDKASKDNITKHTKSSGTSPFSKLASGKGLAIAGSSSSVAFGLYTLANYVLGGSVEENGDAILDDIFKCSNLLFSVVSRLKVLHTTAHLNQSHVSFDLNEGDVNGERQLMMRLINSLVDTIVKLGSEKFLHFLEPLKLMLAILDDVLNGKSSKYMLHHEDVAIYAEIIEASQNKVALDNDATFSRTLGVLPLGLPNITSFIHFLADNTTDNISQFLTKFAHYKSQFPIHQDEIEVSVTAPEEPATDSQSWDLFTDNSSDIVIDDNQVILAAMAHSSFEEQASGHTIKKRVATDAGEDKQTNDMSSRHLSDDEANKLSAALKGALT